METKPFYHVVCSQMLLWLITVVKAACSGHLLDVFFVCTPFSRLRCVWKELQYLKYSSLINEIYYFFLILISGMNSWVCMIACTALLPYDWLIQISNSSLCAYVSCSPLGTVLILIYTWILSVMIYSKPKVLSDCSFTNTSRFKPDAHHCLLSS